MSRYLLPPLLLPFFFLFVVIPFTLLFTITTPTVFQVVFSLSYEQALILFLLIVLGSFINIPLYSKRGRVVVGGRVFFGVLYYTVMEKRITIAVNLGGCVIPSLLALRLLFELPFIPWIVTFVICTAVIYSFARPIPNVGIAVPMFIPPLISALTSYLVALDFGLSLVLIPKLAFSAGVLSALVGADILHLKDVEKIGSGVVSIGGAGTFDGIFLTGVFAVLFSVLLL
jgi:uncharacterized membrane protein